MPHRAIQLDIPVLNAEWFQNVTGSSERCWMPSAAQTGAASGCTAEKSVLTSKQKITICQCEAWKHLARRVTTGAAEFCAPLHFQTSLKESHLDCDIKAWLRTAGSSLKKVKQSLESFISWSNANIFHLCITPTQICNSPFRDCHWHHH